MTRTFERFVVTLLALLGLGLGAAGLVTASWLQFVVGTLLMIVSCWLTNCGFGEKRYE